MKVVGLVVEYNPFHNGHLYHLEQSKKLSGADYSVCIMSGNFIQRGEPAIVSKWARTKMALSAGLDLVIELPAVYAMASAEFFAHGAVSILDSLGVLDYLCFGSENGRLEELQAIADTLAEEPDNYKDLLKAELSRGLSFPSARENALTSYFSSNPKSGTDIKSIISPANNILGIEYLKSLRLLNSTIRPLTICRICNDYNTAHLTGNISSATSIRKNIMSSSGRATPLYVSEAIPPASLPILAEEFEAGRGPVFSKNYDTILLSILRKMGIDQISALPYISEVLENRFREAARASGTIDELVENISTKRYTRTRIQRTLFSILTGLTSNELNTFSKEYGPQYIKVLGFNEKGRQLLSQINEKARLPVIIKTADFQNSCNPLLRRMLEIESQATDMYVLGYDNPHFRKAGQEFTQNIIYMKS